MTATNPSQAYQTFADLYTGLLNRIRADTTSSASTAQAKQLINQGLQDMHVSFSEKFPWAEREGFIQTQPPYTTGAVTIAQGSQSLAGVADSSGVSPAWSTVNAFGVANVRKGGKVLIAGMAEPLTVATVSSGVAITLVERFVGASQAAVPYLYYEPDVAVPSNFLRPVDLQFLDLRQEIALVSRAEFRRRFPYNAVTGKPTVACLIDQDTIGNTTPVRKVRFWRPPDAAYNIPIAFITNQLATDTTGTPKTQMTVDTDEPIVYLRYRYGILLWGLYNWYRDKKDDGRSTGVQQEYLDFLSRTAADTEIGAPRPKIEPRMGVYARGAQAPYTRRYGRRYDVGGAFDRME